MRDLQPLANLTNLGMYTDSNFSNIHHNVKIDTDLIRIVRYG
jgi:hypothetical protein